MPFLIDRRTLLRSTAATLGSLAGGSALAATLSPGGVPLLAPGRMKPSVMLGPATADALPQQTFVAAAFNGGRSQVGVNALQWGGAYPFLNLMKTAQLWSLNDNSGPPTPDTLDEDGYPIKITNGGVYTVFYAPSQQARPGNYVITWTGNGTITLGMSNTAVSGSLSSVGGVGRYVFSTKETRFVLRITAVGSPHITNLQVFHASDEAALAAGQIFGLKFKERLQEARFGVIRFLGWQSGNTTNITSWATRKPVSYYSYQASELRPSVYAGVTLNSGANYLATLAGFKLVDKATVIVKFNASCNSSCTLNVSGTGPVQILNAYAAPMTAGPYWYPKAGTIATLVYDATLNGWIKQGGDASVGSTGIENGCPPELMVRLCAEVGAHPYFVTPPLAIDPATDFIPSLASYCKQSGPAWMIPRFEGPNETWNGASGFYPTGYAKAKAVAYGWGPDVHNWYGKAMSVLGQAVSNVYGNDRSKYHVLCGVQTALGKTSYGTAACNDRLASTQYLKQAQAAQAPYTKTAASKWVTHVACAQYIGPSEINTAQEQTDALTFATASPQTQADIANNYASTVLTGSGPFTVNNVALLYANWKVWAKSFGVLKMCGYEGGYSPDYGGNASVNALRSLSKHAPVLVNATAQNYANFVGLSDAGFTAEFPSCFTLSGPNPSTNAWSVLEDVYQDPVPPQWKAIVAFNN